MALIKCKECGNQISSSAKSCPKCGAKVKSSGCFGKLFKIALYIILTFLAISFIAYLLGPKTVNDKQPKQKEKETPATDSQKETPIVLDTDRILTEHIEKLKAGSKLTRQIWTSNDQTEIQNLRAEKEKLRTNKLGDFSQIDDVLFFKKTFIDAYNKCVSIAEQISQSDNENEINDLITDALVYQTLAYDALLYIQTSDFPRDESKVLSNNYKLLSAIFADERVLKLSIADIKIAVTNALLDLQQAKTELNGL